MRISILTPSYNRAKLLPKLYQSILDNLINDVEIEWLIMDDGSTDETKKIIENFIIENKITIKYFFQNNQGKMRAINNLIENANGDLIIECDSDDYFAKDAFKIIKTSYDIVEDNMEKIYELCFLKYDQNGKNMGNNFIKNTTKMFDLYFKEGENGEKALVFNGQIRKKYKYELEKDEKFITEARMFHKMDEKYDIVCINKPIMICEYQNEGYTKNIINQFKNNPYGYFEYFKEILQKDMRGVLFKKRLYAIKHYILFSILTNQKNIVKQIKGRLNKLLIVILFIPGRIMTKLKIKR